LNTLQDIYTGFRANFIEEPDYSINFYNSNAILLNNITRLNDENELRMYIQINCKYLEALYKKHRYNKTVEYAEIKIPFIESEIERLNAPEVKNDWYYKLYFAKAVAYYYLNEYTKSTDMFKFLVNVDPQDELYKSWLLYSDHGKKRWLINSALIISLVMMITYFMLKSYLPAPVRICWTISQFIIGIGAILYDYLIRRSFKSKLKRKS
jgi:tetratricopeptide (TPR) repeat protein